MPAVHFRMNVFAELTLDLQFKPDWKEKETQIIKKSDQCELNQHLMG